MDLDITVYSSRSLRDVQSIGKQDPYVVIRVGKKKFQTKTCTDAGTSCCIYFIIYLYSLE